MTEEETEGKYYHVKFIKNEGFMFAHLSHSFLKVNASQGWMAYSVRWFLDMAYKQQ